MEGIKRIGIDLRMGLYERMEQRMKERNEGIKDYIQGCIERDLATSKGVDK